jgi:LysM repeat protein
MKVARVVVLLAVLAAVAPNSSRAAPMVQDQNLLVNPTMEQPYDDGKQPYGWGRWFETTGKPADGGLDYVLGPNFSAELNVVIIHGGSASAHIGNKYDPWHAGLKQTVAVPAGTPVRFCAYGRLFANNEDFEKAPSVASKNGHMQVGIYPNGEVDWNANGIIWSAETNPHDTWQQMCMDATVGDSGKVTVFTASSYRGSTAYHLDAWWDDASLVATAPAGTLTPTPDAGSNVPAGANPQVTSAPITCETKPDGSVVRVVESGDSLLGIAFACDSTVDELLKLNGLTSTLISVGQTLIVKGPTSPATPTPQPTTAAPAATSAPAASATPVPNATPAAGQICVQAFNDANADKTKDPGEQLLGGVGFTLSDAAGPKGSYVTSGLEPEPYCFAGLKPGSYTVEARSPVGVAATTESQWQVGLTSDTKFDIVYGGSRNVTPAVDNQPAASATNAPAAGAATGESGGGTSNLARIVLGGIGVLVLLVAGFMAGLVMMRSRR